MTEYIKKSEVISEVFQNSSGETREILLRRLNSLKTVDTDEVEFLRLELKNIFYAGPCGQCEYDSLHGGNSRKCADCPAMPRTKR